MVNKCKKHPTYKAKRKPKADCEKCKQLWGLSLLKRVLSDDDESGEEKTSDYYLSGKDSAFNLLIESFRERIRDKEADRNMKRIREAAAKKGSNKMSLSQINSEIRATRTKKKKKK